MNEEAKRYYLRQKKIAESEGKTLTIGNYGTPMNPEDVAWFRSNGIKVVELELPAN